MKTTYINQNESILLSKKLREMNLNWRELCIFLTRNYRIEKNIEEDPSWYHIKKNENKVSFTSNNPLDEFIESEGHWTSLINGSEWLSLKIYNKSFPDLINDDIKNMFNELITIIEKMNGIMEVTVYCLGPNTLIPTHVDEVVSHQDNLLIVAKNDKKALFSINDTIINTTQDIPIAFHSRNPHSFYNQSDKDCIILTFYIHNDYFID